VDHTELRLQLGKRWLPAIAVRAVKKFAVLSVDAVGVPQFDRGTCTNSNAPNVDAGTSTSWYFASRHVALSDMKASNGSGAYPAAAKEAVLAQLRPGVIPSSACLDFERRSLPTDECPLPTLAASSGWVPNTGLRYCSCGRARLRKAD
jgi:hypothetical protein